MPSRLGIVGVALLATLLAALMPGPAFADHVACGDVITQDTTLDSDLLGCPANGLTIGAANITLDLHGHEISGDGPDPLGADGDTGIFNGSDDVCCFPAYSGVSILDGRIRDFSFGISNRGDGSSIRGLGMTHNFMGIVSRGDGNRIDGNSSVGALGGGLELDGTRNRITRNLASGGEGTGIHIIQGDSLIEHNISTDNGYAGMLVSSSGSIFRDNLVSRNGEGIHFDESGSAELERNVVLDNRVGIYVGDSRGVVLAKNLVARNETGITLASDSDHNRLSRNRIVDNSGFGVVVTPPLGGSPAHDNEVAQNLVLRNGVDGIFVGRSSIAPGNNLLSGNVARSNGDDGIDVEDETTALAGNVASRNSDLGIEAVPGVTDGGGNRAFRNGNPLQCLNIFCKTGGQSK